MHHHVRWLLGVFAIAVMGCSDSGTKSVTAAPSFEVTNSNRVSFAVSSFATTGDGTIIDGQPCDELRIVSEDHMFYGPNMTQEKAHVDKHVYFKLGVPCRTTAGELDVVGVLDGQYQAYGSIRMNSIDRVQQDNFPASERVTLAATPDQGCGFREWRRDHPFSGSIVSTEPSISIEPEDGVTYVGVAMCPPPPPPAPPPPPPPPDPCIFCPDGSEW